MEKNFPNGFSGDGDCTHVFAANKTSDEVSEDASFDAMFNGVSLQSFLTLNQNPTLFPPLLGGYLSDIFPFPDITSPSPSSFFYPPTNANFISSETSASSDLMKLPKTELMTETEFGYVNDMPSLVFPHLPDLHSLEQPPLTMSGFNKRPRVDSVLNNNNNPFQNLAVPYNHKPFLEVPRSALARQRRQNFGEKTRCLQKLLPWDKKMDIATMLEEAYKYVKFLQAQVSSLQSMPFESSMGGIRYDSGFRNVEFSGLERLSRNQLLQVLVNSPVAQTLFCSERSCVFSAEQLGFIQKMAEEKKAFLQQMSAFYPKP